MPENKLISRFRSGKKRIRKEKNTMKKIILFVLTLCLCFSVFSGTAFAEGAGETAGSGMTLDDGTPWIDYSLRENIARTGEKPDSPKDDFYLWVNHNWLKTAEIAPGQYADNAFTYIDREIMNQCLEVLTDTTMTSGDAVAARQLYNAFLDWDARNALGIAPLKEVIDRISAVSTIDELTELLCSRDYAGYRLFAFDVSKGLNDPDAWITAVQPVRLLLRDSAEYRQRTDQGNLIESAYREFLPKMLERLGYSPEEASAMLTRAFALEAELAESIMTSAESMAPDYSQRINNVMSRAEAETLCSAFPWLRILDEQGYAGVQRYQVEQPAYLRKADEIYREERLEDIKNLLILKNVNYFMFYLDRESYDLYNGMYNQINGIETTQPDEEAACQTVRSTLPTQMDRAFFEKYDATKMKADITRICGEIIDCYRRMLGKEDWLTEETRAKAIEKLDAIHFIAVFPDKWPDYSGLTLEGLGYYDCIRAIDRQRDRISVSLADQPVDHDLWYRTLEDDWANDVLQTNAMYDPRSNSIIILRGVLGGVLYRENMSDEELCGSIGLIIAHEISHAFDPTGAQFDATGRMNNWWTEADHAAFDARAQRLIDYCNGITAFSGLRVAGESVQGEAVADLGAAQCMLNLLEEKKGDVDYRAFFETIAGTWRQVITWEVERYYLLQDSHMPNYLRVNTMVQQFPQFHETYGITEGDGMWLAPENRVPVW